MDQNLHAARACEDAGITALGGGDYDGDDLHVAADSALINLSQTEESEQSGRSKNRVTEQNGQTVLCSFAPLPFLLLLLFLCSLCFFVPLPAALLFSAPLVSAPCS